MIALSPVVTIRVLVAAAPPGHPCLDAVASGYRASLIVHEAPEGTMWVRDDREAEGPGEALLGAALEMVGGASLDELAAYIADGLGREPGLSPVEAAVLPAVLHLLGDEDRELARPLLPG